MALKYLRSKKKKKLKNIKEKNKKKKSGLIWYEVSDRGVKDQVQSA